MWKTKFRRESATTTVELGDRVPDSRAGTHRNPTPTSTTRIDIWGQPSSASGFDRLNQRWPRPAKGDSGLAQDVQWYLQSHRAL